MRDLEQHNKLARAERVRAEIVRSARPRRKHLMTHRATPQVAYHSARLKSKSCPDELTCAIVDYTNSVSIPHFGTTIKDHMRKSVLQLISHGYSQRGPSRRSSSPPITLHVYYISTRIYIMHACVPRAIIHNLGLKKLTLAPKLWEKGANMTLTILYHIWREVQSRPLRSGTIWVQVGAGKS